jgi:hypothetical protein
METYSWHGCQTLYDYDRDMHVIHSTESKQREKQESKELIEL